MEYFPILLVAVASVCVTAFSVTTILKHRESEPRPGLRQGRVLGTERNPPPAA